MMTSIAKADVAIELLALVAFILCLWSIARRIEPDVIEISWGKKPGDTTNDGTHTWSNQGPKTPDVSLGRNNEPEIPEEFTQLWKRRKTS